MDYCPEIAVLHASFALAEIKDKESSKSSQIFSKCKDQRTGEAFLLIKNAIWEIVGGLEASRSQDEQQKWSRLLHKLLYEKAFVYNKTTPTPISEGENQGPGALQLLCRPLPEFHPSLYFELVHEMDWTGCIGEILVEADWPDCLEFASACLDYCCCEPSLPNDLSLLATVMDILASSVTSELLEACSSDLAMKKTKPHTKTAPLVLGWKQKCMGAQDYTKLASCLMQVLELLCQRCSSQKSEEKSELTFISRNPAEIRTVVFSQILPCLMLLSLFSLSSDAASCLALRVNRLFAFEDEEEVTASEATVPDPLDLGGRDLAITISVAKGQEQGLMHLREAAFQKWFITTLHQLLLPQGPYYVGVENLRSENDLELGTQICLEFRLAAFIQPMKTSEMMKELCLCFAAYLCQQNMLEHNSAIKLVHEEVQKISAVVTQRDKEEEEKRRNPSLSEVTERVQKRLPRWKACLQYGLAKRELDSWWLAGFWDLLQANQTLLCTESDVMHLIQVFGEMAKASIGSVTKYELGKAAELTLAVFSRLKLTAQERIILYTYQNTEMPHLPLLPDFDQSLRVMYNKLTVSTGVKDLHKVMGLALHNPLSLIQSSVHTAVTSAGQIPIIVKILALMPAVCRSCHPVHHSECSLLCHCVRSVLMSGKLNSSEQKNLLGLLGSLIKTYKHDDKQSPVLLLSDFLTTCVLPFITTQCGTHPVSAEFALRLLICCLDSALSVGFSDWLEEIHLAALVVCCADILQGCVELVTGREDMNYFVQLKNLVLTALGLIEKHLCAQEHSLKGNSLRWIREVCSAYDWTVVAYLGNIITSSTASGNSEVLSQLLAKVVSATEALPYLRLAVISDEAEKQAVQEIMQMKPTIHENSLLIGMFQVLPNLLVGEVRRVVHLVSALIDAESVRVGFRCLFLNNINFSDLNECKKELLSSQLLMDAAILICQHHQNYPQPILHHLGQLLVAGFQEVLLSVEKNMCRQESTALANFQIFSHICIVMACAPDLTEALYVALFDILAKYKPVSMAWCDDNTRKCDDILVHALRLVPEGAMKKTLCKKVEHFAT